MIDADLCDKQGRIGGSWAVAAQAVWRIRWRPMIDGPHGQVVLPG